MYVDDILVTGATVEEHLRNLDAVLGILENAGLRLNKSKCFFLRSRIEYLGNIIDGDGLHPTDEKVTTLKEAPPPTNLTELRSFLGIVNYYAKFLPNLATTLTPLYRLLHKNTRWVWTDQQERAFQQAKEALQTDSVLAHYDSTKPLLLACDASEYGIGAVLSHILEDGQEKPIAYMSRTLNSAERGYSQLEREGLAIVHAVKKFHNYIYGRCFTIESDHQPLSHLFSESKGIPVMASARIQRWALTLAAYQYNIRYKPGKTLNNADALSRLPRPVTTTDDCSPAEHTHLICHLSSTSIDAGRIKQWTARDPLLSQVLRYVQTGWPNELPDEKYKPFVSRKDKLSSLNGCILWGSRIVIPPQGRTFALQELHDTHPGCSKMKSLARNYIWWPHMDAAIEATVKECQTCQQSRPSPPIAPLHPWEWPYSPRFRWPFQRIYVPCARGRTLQMDGCAPHAINHLCKNNRETTHHICKPRTTPQSRYRQRSIFYQCRISRFHDKQWKTMELFTSNLHPITQQPMAWLKGRFKHSKREYLESQVAQFKRKSPSFSSCTESHLIQSHRNYSMVDVSDAD